MLKRQGKGYKGKGRDGIRNVHNLNISKKARERIRWCWVTRPSRGGGGIGAGLDGFKKVRSWPGREVQVARKYLKKAEFTRAFKRPFGAGLNVD